MPLRRWITFGFLAAGLAIGLQGLYSSRVSRSERTTETLALPPLATVSAVRTTVPSRRPSVEDWWQRRWQELNTLADESLRNQEREALIEDLAAVNPWRALELAQSETNLDLQTKLLEATMRGWGGTNPEAALAWAASQEIMDSGQAMASVFHGVAKDPETALRLTAQMSAQDPDRARDYGSYLVAALGRAGEFGKASDFAAQSDPEVRVDRLSAAYSGWAATDPQAALIHATQLADPEMQATAFNVIITRWADRDAKAVAQYALTMEDEHRRKEMFSVTLPTWVANDGEAAAEWLVRFPASSELDLGVACVATQPDAARQPAAALSWAENIVDPQLRTRVLATVINKWAALDPVAARQYAEASPNVRPEERAGVLAAFEADYEPISLLP